MSLDWETIEFEYIDELIKEESNQSNFTDFDVNNASEETLSAMDVDDFLAEDITDVLTEDIDGIINEGLLNGTFDSHVDFLRIPRAKAKKETLRNHKCEVCNIKLPSLAYLKRHFNTKGHKRKLGIVKEERSDRVEELTELTNDEIELLDMFDRQITQMHGEIESSGSILDGFDFDATSSSSEAIMTFNLTSDPSQAVSIPIKTAPKPSKAFFCPLCNKSFSQKCYYTQHNTTHHSGDKPFKCEKCGKKFPTDYERSVHAMKHESTLKPFRCVQCDRAYNNKVDLRRHEKNHDTRKPFPCEICRKEFVRKDHLEKHYSVHERKGMRNLMKMTGLKL